LGGLPAPQERSLSALVIPASVGRTKQNSCGHSPGLERLWSRQWYQSCGASNGAKLKVAGGDGALPCQSLCPYQFKANSENIRAG